MQNIVKKGLFISFVYLMAVVSTLLITNRVAELETSDFTNNNKSITIKLSN